MSFSGSRGECEIPGGREASVYEDKENVTFLHATNDYDRQ